MTWTIHNGDCLEVMATLEASSVDAIVSDPPYGLSFMGKGWDHGVPGVEFWREALRVAKPGCHLLAFGGTRTYHRLACAIEDAGWEIRDCLGWLYGSGFPKSLDVSKAIDKGHGENRERQLQFTAWMRSTGLRSSEARDILFSAGLITEKSNQASHYFAETIGSQPAIATADMFDKLRPYLPEVPEYIERLVCERTGLEWTAYKQRPVVGHREMGFAPGTNAVYGQYSGDTRITAPATDAAKQWQGWGTALKPAWEPIIMARKPLCGTVAENVLTHGTGGLNVDGCRVEGNRWPANIMHDGSEEATQPMGEASQFFYCAKASKRDRDEGCEGMEAKKSDLRSSIAAGIWEQMNAAHRNHHPTVKPTELMRYLCRLVTPPGGVVLDPFTGSGSTGKAAILERFSFIGIERESEYCEIARARIGKAERDVSKELI